MTRAVSLTLVASRLTYDMGHDHLPVPERGNHGLDDGLGERIVDRARGSSAWMPWGPTRQRDRLESLISN
jgi:hypothetical protein